MVIEIQYLRAAAVLMVLLAHAAFLKEASHLSEYFEASGAAGVDMFFVISGYVVTGSLLRKLRLEKSKPFLEALENNIDNLKAFFIKRTFRLVPVIFLLVAAHIFMLICGLTFSGSTNVREELVGLYSQILMKSDFDQIILVQNHGVLRSVNHFWSLAVEEKFYLFTPFLILAFGCLRRFSTFGVFVIVGVSIVKALGLADDISVNGFLRFDSFMFGIIIYYLETETAVFQNIFRSKLSLLTMNVLTLAVLAIIAALPVEQMQGNIRLYFSSHAMYYPTVYLLTSILIVWAVQRKGYVLAIPGFRRVLHWIGDRSYNIYVFQFFCFDLTYAIAGWMHIGNEHNFRLSCIFVIVMAAVSELIFRCVETPLRRYGGHIAKQVVAEQEKAGDCSPALAG